jgi:hypothetical protein
MGVSVTYYSSNEIMMCYLLEGIATPFFRYDELNKKYEIGYCTVDKDKCPNRIYLFKDTIQNVTIDANKVNIQLSREGYVRFYNTSLHEYLVWEIKTGGPYNIAHLVGMDST